MRVESEGRLNHVMSPDDTSLQLFSLRIRDEPASSNSLISLISSISEELGADAERLSLFEGRLLAAGYSPAHAERYAEMRFRVVDERLYRVAEGFPRLWPQSFDKGVPPGVERIEYEINLEGFANLIVATSAKDFQLPD